MKEKPRIVFMGTPAFAVPSLEILVQAGFDIAAVVTVPDKPAGRGQQLRQSAVKEYALSRGLKVLQPVNLKDQAWIIELQSLKANLQVVVAFRMLPESVWMMPSSGTFNLHASLLPQYRGAAPINWAIMNGEKETGLTTFFLKHEIDTGNILFQEKVPVGPEETAGELHDRLMNLGASLVLKTVRSIEAGDYVLKQQSEMQIMEPLKTAPKLTKETCRIHQGMTARQSYNTIRGLCPYPAALVDLRNKETNAILNLKIFKALFHDENQGHEPGSVETDGKSYLKLFFAGGSLSLTEFQAAGKSRMDVKSFLNGNKFNGTFSFA